MLPGDRLVCAFVRPQAVGFQFKRWLLHVTIVPWFRLDEPSNVIVRGLEEAVRAIGPFEAVGAGETLMGPKKNRLVRLLQMPTPFTDIEAKVRNYLHKKRAWLVDETTKRRQEFRPHVTFQGEESLESDATFRVEQLYIVEQKGDYKVIVSEVRLGER